MQRALLLFSAVLWMLPLSAQELSDPDVVLDEAEEAVLLEEITIKGQRSLNGMRLELQRAEDNFYAMFNELNSSDDMDIVCRINRKVNSHIRVRVCEPVFFSKMRMENSRKAMGEIRQAFSAEDIDQGIDPVLLQNGLEYIDPDWVLRELAENDYQEMNEEILRIALENPEYLSALRKIGELRAAYEAERKNRFNRN